jgi:hypothetical protein
LILEYAHVARLCGRDDDGVRMEAQANYFLRRRQRPSNRCPSAGAALIETSRLR